MGQQAAQARNIGEMIATRERPHFTSIVGPRTAHVVIDLQVGFMRSGAPFEVPAARNIVANVNRLSKAVRAAGGLNVFMRYTIDPDEPVPWRSYQELMPAEQRAMSAVVFRRGAETHGLWPDLDVQADDKVLDKTRMSCFIPGTCDLHDLLQARGIDTLIITGTLTNGCCESTARDAGQMSYRVFFIEDANAAWSVAEHEATLKNMSMAFADVRPAQEVLGLLAQFQAAGAA
ncbi:MAG TPA: cysteine hydrolase [Caulobacteraceae bacterium]|nr:cysteine hydrolase [Caulobacteraceae bacterium]